MSRRSKSNGRHPLVIPVSVGVIGLTLIGIGQTVPNRHAIQDELTSNAAEALAASGFSEVSVSFSGRDATVTGADAVQAATVVAAVDGVRVAEAVVVTPIATSEPTTEPTTDPGATEAATPAATAQPTLPIGFTLVDGTITATGTVSSAAARTDLLDAVSAAGNGWTVVDRLIVDESSSPQAPAPDRLPAVTELLAQAPTGGAKLVIQYRGESVILRGAPSTADSERALLTAAAATVATPSQVVDGLDTAGPN